MEPLQQHLDSLLREEQVINCVTCAFCIVSFRRGLTPYQQSDFNTPMGGKKVSPEEELHQDLVWVLGFGFITNYHPMINLIQ